MAGRGGRGRGGRGRGFTFDIAAIGFGRGDQLPSSIQQPPPIFPPAEYQAVPLNTSSVDDYLLALKQEFRTVMRDSPYYIRPPTKNTDIERYSDKYKQGKKVDKEKHWKKDWRRFPKELKPVKPRVKTVSNIKPRLDGAKARKSKPAGGEDVAKKIQSLDEKTDQNEDEEGEAGEGENEDEEVEYDEEEQEEDNDYLLSYFEDGDDYGHGDDDDMDEGPTY